VTLQKISHGLLFGERLFPSVFLPEPAWVNERNSPKVVSLGFL